MNLLLGSLLLALAAWVIVSYQGRLRRSQTEAMPGERTAPANAQSATASVHGNAGFDKFSKQLLLSLQGQDTLADFGSVLLQQLCRQLDAQAASFHVLQADSYVQQASYAGMQSPAFIERYRAGEGLAGQAVRERKSQVCSGQATDWMWVVSGTQASAPVSVVIAPILSADHVPGVVELALMRPAEPETLALLDNVLPMVALSLDLLLGKLQTLAEFARYRDMQEFQQRLLSNVSDGIFGQDPQGKVTFVNAAALRLLGYTEQELLGQPMHAMTHHHYPDGRVFPIDECPCYHSLHDGQTRTVSDQVFWHKQGHALPIEYTVTPVLQNAQRLGVVVTFRDITQQLQARSDLEQRDRQLQESEAWLRTLFESANEGILVIDTQASVTALNPAMARMLGRTREQILGHQVIEFMDETNRAIHRRQMALRAHGQVADYEIAFLRPDGTLAPCLMHASPLTNAQGERSGSFAMVTDLSRWRLVRA